MVPAVALQKAIYNSMNDYYPVHEIIPKNSTFPFVQIGEISKDENFTKTDQKRFTFNVVVHGWTKGLSSNESKVLEHFIYQQMIWLFLDDYDVEFVELVMNTNLDEKELEEVIFHSVQEFEITLSEIK